MTISNNQASQPRRCSSGRDVNICDVVEEMFWTVERWNSSGFLRDRRVLRGGSLMFVDSGILRLSFTTKSEPH